MLDRSPLGRFPLMDIGVADAAYHLMGDPVDLLDWGPRHGASPQLMEQLLSNDCRYFFEGPDISDVDMIIACVDQLHARDPDCLTQVRYLVHAHTQNFSMPAPPQSLLAELAHHYGLQLSLSFSVCHLACASVINAIRLAAELLQEDPEAQYALVITSDRTFGGAEHRLRPPGCIQSDGGSAILLSKQRMRCRLGLATAMNFAQLHEGPSNPVTKAATARLTWLHTKQLFRDHCDRTGIALEDYGTILPVNADKHYWVQIAKGLQLDASHFFFDNIAAMSHACCADLAINLVQRGFHLLEQGLPVIACGQSNIGAHAALTLIPTDSFPSSVPSSLSQATP